MYWRSGSVRAARAIVVTVAISAASLALLDCGSSGSGNTTGPGTGSLAVTIAAPNGVAPSVTVSGPAGYSKTLSATQTLTGLAAGSYTVTAARVTTTGPIVGTVDTGAVSGSPASVTAGGTANASATYAPVPGSGGLWATGFGTSASTVYEYTGAQLASTTSAPPAVALATDSAIPGGLAVDRNGTVWVSDFTDSSIFAFSASQLATSGHPAPIVTITPVVGAHFFPEGVAFDNAGNLWVSSADLTTPVVIELTTAQLATGGAVTPAVIITGPALSQPAGLAFDRAGDLWVGNSHNSTVVEFTANQLAATGSPTPVVTLSTHGNSLVLPVGLAFDSAGDLWATHTGTADSSGVVEFTASQIVTTGSPAPAVQVNEPTNAGIPLAVAFDAGGNLWMSNQPGATPFIFEFTTSQIAASGTPTPTTTITTQVDARAIAFNPHSSGLPLH